MRPGPNQGIERLTSSTLFRELGEVRVGALAAAWAILTGFGLAQPSFVRHCAA